MDDVEITHAQTPVLRQVDGPWSGRLSSPLSALDRRARSYHPSAHCNFNSCTIAHKVWIDHQTIMSYATNSGGSNGIISHYWCDVVLRRCSSKEASEDVHTSAYSLYRTYYCFGGALFPNIYSSIHHRRAPWNTTITVKITWELPYYLVGASPSHSPASTLGRRPLFSRCLPMVSPRQRVGETPTIW